MIRRIDRKVFNADNPNIKNTLKDLKIVDNSALLVELKDPTELQQEQIHGDDGEVITINKESAPTKDEEMIDIDSTENIRTVIVNMDSDKNTFDRYQINIDWTLQELTDYILKEKQLEPPYKLRNLTTQRLFVKEELDTKMRSYQDFQIGGARVQLEYGRYPSMSEIVVLVSLKGQESHYESFYVPSNATVKELKTQVCKEFGGLDEAKYTLYRVNYLEEPVFPLRRDN